MRERHLASPEMIRAWRGRTPKPEGETAALQGMDQML